MTVFSTHYTLRQTISNKIEKAPNLENEASLTVEN